MGMPALLRDSFHALADQAAAFEALLLIASALHKAVQWSPLRGVVREFAGVPSSLAPLVLAGVAGLEAVAGGLLWVPRLRTVGALLAAAVWTTYLALIGRAILQGRRDADCGCSFGPAHSPLGSYQAARNALLIGLAIGVALDGLHPAEGSLQASQLLAACALLALYGALDQVMGLQTLRSGEAV
jgi:uncharacterized membrane protein YphA (DoxX/SURF4 family)